MRQVSAAELQRHIKWLHKCRAEYRESVAVREEFQGAVAWEGVVHVFSLDDHPNADSCYAWSSLVEGSENRRFFAVLRTEQIDTPAKAVRAAIVSDARNDNAGTH